jgi:hypothetical protein
MSDYVEARYALVMLAEARLAEPVAANRLVSDFLRDCALKRGKIVRHDALSSICRLRDQLRTGHMPEAPAWDSAVKAAKRWQLFGDTE